MLASFRRYGVRTSLAVLPAVILTLFATTAFAAQGSFSDIAASPNRAKTGTQVKITFTASMTPRFSPVVTVNKHSASLFARSGLNYAYLYTIKASDLEGPATIVIKTSNFYTATDTTALAVDRTPPDLTCGAAPGIISANAQNVTITVAADEALGALPSVAVNSHSATYVSADGNNYTYSYAVTPSDPEDQAWVDVIAYDIAKNQTKAHLSLFLIDRVAPVVTNLKDDGQYTASTSQLNASWSAADATTGVAECQYAVGSTPFGADIRNWTSVGTETSCAAIGLNLSSGSQYYISVKARDAAGNWSAVVTTDGITVDTTPPTAPMVVDDGAFTGASSLHATWSPAADDESGIASYEYAVGFSSSDPKCGYVIPWTSVGNATSATCSPALKQDHIYYFYVRAKNGAGAYSPAGTSDGIIIGSYYHYVDKDLLANWGTFESYVDTAYSEVLPSGDHYGGRQPLSDNDHIAVGWARSTALTGPPIDPPVSDDQVRSWFKYRLQSGGRPSGYQYMGFSSDVDLPPGELAKVCLDNDLIEVPSQLQPGDKLVLTLDYYSANNAGAVVDYLAWLGYWSCDQDGNNCEWVSANTRYLNAGTVSNTTVIEWQIPQLPAGKRISRIVVKFGMFVYGPVAQGVEPSMSIDGAHLYMDKQTANSGFARTQEVLPVPRNRDIKTMLMFYGNASPWAGEDPYQVAANYDYVEFSQGEPYAKAYRIPYYSHVDGREDTRQILYFLGGSVMDAVRATSPESDGEICPSPILYQDPVVGDILYDATEHDASVSYAADQCYLHWSANGYPAVRTDNPNLFWANEGSLQYAQAWSNRVLGSMSAVPDPGKYCVDGVFIDDLGPKDLGTSFASTEPWETQSFLHTVVPGLHASLGSNFEIMQNAGVAHLKNGYLSDQSVIHRFPEFGSICFDPNWQPATATPYYNTTDYAANAWFNTPDSNYKEWAFLIPSDAQYNIYGYYGPSPHWWDCLQDMLKIAQISSAASASSLPKKTHVQVIGYDNLQDPAEGINGWAHFGLCSYLLGQNDYTSLDIVRLVAGVSAPHVSPLGVDFGVVNALGHWNGDPVVLQQGSDPQLDVVVKRSYENGLVVVNASPTTSATFQPAALAGSGQTVYEEVSGEAYASGSTFTLPPHSGRIFFFH